MRTESSSFFDLEAERAVLGTVLIDNAALSETLGLGLAPKDFYLGQHQILFQAMLDLDSSNLPLDLVTLTSRLSQTKRYEAAGGTATLTGLLADAFRVANIKGYTRIILERASLRKVSRTCAEIQAQLSSGVDDVPAFMNSAEATLFEATQSGRGEGLQSVQSILPDFIAEIEARASSGADSVGLKTGFKEVDRLTNGLRPHQVWVIAARPGIGKTSFALSIIQYVATRLGGVVAMFSMEMKKTELVLRLISGMTGIDSRRLMLGQLKDNEWARLAEAADKASRAKAYIDESGGITALDIRSRCRRLKHREKRLDLVVIDYLQLIQPTSHRNSGTPESDLATISRNLKELAKELDVPMIVLSQLNRATVTSGQDKRPTLSNLRGSGAIEQDADLVTFIHRDDAYDPKAENSGIAEIIFAKNRSGQQGTAQLAWLPHITLFANLEGGAGDLPSRT